MTQTTKQSGATPQSMSQSNKGRVAPIASERDPVTDRNRKGTDNTKKRTNRWTDIEQTFVEGLLLEPRANCEPQHVRRLMRKVAYHEAGHAVAKAFTGNNWSHLVRMSIIPNLETLGRVSSEREFGELLLSSYPAGRQRDRAGHKFLLENLAGRGAELRLGGDLACEQILDPDSEEWDTEGTDLFRAKRVADCMARRHVSAGRILSLAEKWTMEMLALPEVWAVVQNVAELLLDQGTIELTDENYYVFQPIMFRSSKLSQWKHRLHSSQAELRKLAEAQGIRAGAEITTAN